MKPIKDFDEFVQNRTVKKQSIDKSRAEFLLKEAENSYEFLLEKIKKIVLTDKNSNDFVKSCHDIIIEIVRADMLLRGYNEAGAGADEAEVAYMRVLGFDESIVQFADQIRYFRNGMLYYGTVLDKEYAEKVIEFTKKIYSELKEKCRE